MTDKCVWAKPSLEFGADPTIFRGLYCCWLGLSKFNRKVWSATVSVSAPNTAITDSTALSEQVVQDAKKSVFNSAGQRCSTL